MNNICCVSSLYRRQSSVQTVQNVLKVQGSISYSFLQEIYIY